MDDTECEVKALKKDISLAKRCPNTAREFLEYEIEKDTNGNFKGCFPDKTIIVLTLYGIVVNSICEMSK